MPHRSTTSRWQVSPRVWPRRSTVGSPAPTAGCCSVPSGRGNLGVRPPGAPGRSSSEAVVADQPPAFGGVRLAQQLRQRGSGVVAVPGLPIGEGQLAAFDDGVQIVGAEQAGRGQVEAGQQRELLQEHRALPPGAGLADLVAVVVEAGRLLDRAAPAGQIRAGQHAGMTLAGRIAHRPADVLGDRLGNEPFVEAAAGCLDLGLPAGAAGAALSQQPTPGGCQRRIAQPAAGGRHGTTGKPGRCRSRPVVAERPGHRLDGGPDRRQYRKALLGIADRRRQHVGQPPAAPVSQQPQPAAERAGHGGGEQPGARHHRQSLVPIAGNGRRGRCHALPGDHPDRLVFGIPEQDRYLAARAVQVRFDDLQHETGGHRRVGGVAAALEHAHADRGAEPVGARHHAEVAAQVGPGGECRRFHDAIPFVRGPGQPTGFAEIVADPRKPACLLVLLSGVRLTGWQSSTTLTRVLADLTAESAELDGRVAELPETGWATPTPAAGWTIAHQIAHLNWTDRLALLAIDRPDQLAEAMHAATADPHWLRRRRRRGRG